MAPKAGYSTPMLHVIDMQKSIDFYQLLGFELIDTEGDPIGWARLHCEGGAIMLFLAEHPIDTSKPGIMQYMYTEDLPAFREHLLANGIPAPAIKHPPYTPSGELSLKDPDGNLVFVAHWSDKEHSAWLEKLAKRKAAKS